MRAFIAINLSDAVRNAVAGLQSRLSGSVEGVRWVRPDVMHLTLHFLGEIEASAVTDISSAMDEAVASRAPFDITVRGVGLFGRPNRPRVVWAGVADGCDRVSSLHEQLMSHLGEAGIQAATRPYSPHITVGRVKDARKAGGLARALESVPEALMGNIHVTCMVLVESVLKPDGPVYRTVHEARLKA